VGHVTRIGEMITAYNTLVGKPEGKSPLGRLRRTWEDNIKMDLKEIRWESVDLMNLALGQLAGSCEHSNETSGSILGGDFLD